MKIIIAICTCNRLNWLKKLLKSIEKSENLDYINYEVLVVDNYKTGNARELLNNGKFYNFILHYIHEKTPGIPYARNAAAKWAIKHNAVALIFIDDDEVVRPHWLSSLVGYYFSRQPYVQVVQGPVYPIFLKPLPSMIPEDLYCKKRPYETGHKLNIASTNNVIIDLKLFTEHKFLFNEKMAMCGGSDNNFFRKVHEQGFNIEWCREAETDEYVDGDRVSFFWLMKRYYRFGACSSYSLILDGDIKKARKLQLKRALHLFRMAIKEGSKFKKQSGVYFLRYMVEGVGMIAGLWGFQYNEYLNHHK